MGQNVPEDCPACGRKNSFRASVRGNNFYRRCPNCKYHEAVPLPKILKKIVYLDQYFFSNVFKAQDPKFKKSDSRFIKAAQQIQHLSATRLLVAPYSSIHQDETYLCNREEGNAQKLMNFIIHFSHNHKFKPAYDVELAQIIRAFKAFIGETFDQNSHDIPLSKPRPVLIEESDALEGNIHHWDETASEYFTSRYSGDPDQIRNLKRQSIEHLTGNFVKWRESNLTFQEAVSRELQAAAGNYLDLFFKDLDHLNNCDMAAFWNSPVRAGIVREMLRCLPPDIPPEDRLKHVACFFNSRHFAEIPYHQLSARIFAKLFFMVKNGSYSEPMKALKKMKGFFFDVEHIALYAPYCDAIVIDKPMAELVADKEVGLQNNYGVKIFSLNNWDEFLAWLEKIEQEMSAEHRAGLQILAPLTRLIG